MKVSEFRKLIREEVRRALKEEQSGMVYRYDFTLSRGLFYEGEDQVSTQEMINYTQEMWKEQGPTGYDIMQIYASKNVETKDPVVALELEDAIVMFSPIELSEQVAIATAKKAAAGTTIKPEQMLSYLKVK